VLNMKGSWGKAGTVSQFLVLNSGERVK
jgi:hypothetical protein